MNKQCLRTTNVWVIRKNLELVWPRAVHTTAPRNLADDPAFSSDFNLPLSEQFSPIAEEDALGGGPLHRTTIGDNPYMDEDAEFGDVKNTPSNDFLRKLAADKPPPPSWFEGDEEDLF